jgi:hypothetical protein
MRGEDRMKIKERRAYIMWIYNWIYNIGASPSLGFGGR